MERQRLEAEESQRRLDRELREMERERLEEQERMAERQQETEAAFAASSFHETEPTWRELARLDRAHRRGFSAALLDHQDGKPSSWPAFDISAIGLEGPAVARPADAPADAARATRRRVFGPEQ